MPLARRRNRAYAIAAAIIVPCAAALFTLGAFAGGGFPSLPGPAKGGADLPPGSLSLPSAPLDTAAGGQASTTVGTPTSNATVASTATHPHPRSMTASTYRVTTSPVRRDTTTRRFTTAATTRGTSTTFGTTTDGGTTDTTLTTTATTTTADTTTPTVAGP